MRRTRLVLLFKQHQEQVESLPYTGMSCVGRPTRSRENQRVVVLQFDPLCRLFIHKHFK